MLAAICFHDLLADHFLAAQVTSNLVNANVDLEDNWLVSSFQSGKF